MKVSKRNTENFIKMPRISKLVFGLSCLAITSSYAQDSTAVEQSEELITDRPDQTESASIVPIGTIQWETGAMVEIDKPVSTVTNTSYTYNTSLFRIGLTKSFEFRIIQEYVNEHVESPSISKGVSGFGPLALGAKFKISEENGFIPEAAFLTHVTIPTGLKDFRPTSAAMDFRFIGENTLTDRLGLAYNFGGQWSGDDTFFTGVYTLVLGVGVTDKFGLFFESYGFLPEKGLADHRADAGCTYLITDLIQLDLSGGFGITEVAPDYFISGGISLRVPK